MAGIGHRGFFRRKGNEPQGPFFTFKTKFNGEVSFEITKSGAPATWYMGDGTIYTNTNSVTHTYTDGSEKTVSVSVDSLADVTGLGNFSDKGITYFDASSLNMLSGEINFNDNADLSNFITPQNYIGTGFTALYFNNCTSLTSFDGSGIIYMEAGNFGNSSRVYFDGCSNLATYVFPNTLSVRLDCRFSNTALTDKETFAGLEKAFRITLQNTPVSGALNLTDCTELGDLIITNSQITSINFHPVSVTRTSLWVLWAEPTNTLASLDLSKNIVTVGTCRIWVNSSSLSTFIEPTATNRNMSFRIRNGSIPGYAPINVNRFSELYMDNQALTELTLLPLDQVREAINMRDNMISSVTNLVYQTTIINSNSNSARVNFSNNSMSAALVNQILVEYDSVGTGGKTNHILYLDGSNASPDSSSGGFDGVAAKASLVLKGYTVLTN